jgi:hypothetical protein
MRKQVAAILEKMGLKKKAIKQILFIRGKSREIEKKIRMAIIYYQLRKRSKSGYYAIDLDSDWLGLGSRIIQTIEILLYCDTYNLTPVVRYNYKEKISPQTDYFKEIFFYKFPLLIDEKKIMFTKVRDNEELQFKENYNQKLKLSFAKSLFEKYLGINQRILEEVELYEKQWFKNEKILGVHYRGTDKAGEAPLLPKEELLKFIVSAINEDKNLKIIFLSTDDEEIINFLKKSALELPLVYRGDAIRSADGEQFHRKEENSKSIVNRDAIVNCLLLSKCHVLLKTASMLSDCSVIFNPAIKVKVISVPHNKNITWWPATEINEYATFNLTC